MNSLISSIILAEDTGQDISNLVATMAEMPNPSTLDSDGKPLPYGVEGIQALLAKVREKAKASAEKALKRKAREAKVVAQNDIKTAVESFGFIVEDADTLRGLAEKAGGLDAFITVVVAENGEMTLSVGGLKTTSPTSGGKPAKNQPRPFLSVSTGERVVGSLTDWARENVNGDVLKLAKHTKAGKLRGGKVLETFLKSTHEVDGESFGPFVSLDDGEDFAAAVSAWEATKGE